MGNRDIEWQAKLFNWDGMEHQSSQEAFVFEEWYTQLTRLGIHHQSTHQLGSVINALCVFRKERNWEILGSAHIHYHIATKR